jgi:hypothetical protein
MKLPLALAGLFAIASLSVAWTEEPRPVKEPVASDKALPSVDQARRQAEILHDTLHSTLQIVHHRYYREDEGLRLPAATLKEVFAELEQRQGIKVRWLAVEGQAMNTDHNPQDEFEHEAVKSLKADKPFYEQSANGHYRRAGPITLTNHCLKCHVPDRKSTEDRTAGLLISIPVQGQ